MIKFWIATRPKPGMDREQFDFEWGVIHCSLMVTTPSVLNGSFRRYTQHRAIDDLLGDDALPYPRSPEGWYSCADHLCATYDDVIASVTAPDYLQRIFHHRFSDKAMVVELTGTEERFDSAPTRLGAGGVKVINFVKARPGISQGEFSDWWRSDYAGAVLETAAHDGPVTRYVQNPSRPLDPTFFTGTLFELGNAGTYAGVEELWFDTVGDAARLRGDPAIHQRLSTVAAEMIDAEGSFSMPVVERVVFDFTGEFAHQGPAVRDPSTVEHRMLQSERPWAEWNTVRPVE